MSPKGEPITTRPGSTTSSPLSNTSTSIKEDQEGYEEPSEKEANKEANQKKKKKMAAISLFIAVAVLSIISLLAVGLFIGLSGIDENDKGTRTCSIST